MNPRVVVSLVTYNSGKYLRDCLESLKAQTCSNLRVLLWDNASTDDSLEIIAEWSDLFETAHISTRNIGFCAAHNRLIASGDSDFVFVLNPDVVLEPAHIETLVSALDQDENAGSATGKLWRWQGIPVANPRKDSRLSTFSKPQTGEPGSGTRILDTTGIYFTSNQRHLDRGSGERDTGQYQRQEYVFGASGAAALYRRRMLQDIRAGDQYFDEDFFAYREDADLAWRAQWMGWRCLYVPEACGFHVRQVLPEKRRQISREINMHSFKNRFLLRVKNMDAGTYVRFFLPITFRDIGAFAYVLSMERSSLRGIPLFFKALPRAWAFRRALRAHRRTPAREVRTWFKN